MPEITTIPHINASLNALSVVFLVLGFIFIKNGHRVAHRAAMIGALVVSAAFLVFYVYYKLNSGFAKFGGEGLIRPVYFSILAIHVLGAIAIVPMVPMVVSRAIRGQFDRHRTLARWTWPLWTFVGVSGVVVYWMAIRLYPYTG